jgi:hypothetical protein
MMRNGAWIEDGQSRKGRVGAAMGKRAYFNTFWGAGWPPLSELKPYFLSPPGERWFFETGNDSAGLSIEGVDDTEHLPPNRGRIDIDLAMWGHSEHGVLLIYSKWGGGRHDNFTSKGDMSRLGEIVRSTHDTPLPVGLFIPYAEAWKAVKEFIETDGKLPQSIEWVANRDLPPNTFPDP